MGWCSVLLKTTAPSHPELNLQHPPQVSMFHSKDMRCTFLPWLVFKQRLNHKRRNGNPPFYDIWFKEMWMKLFFGRCLCCKFKMKFLLWNIFDLFFFIVFDIQAAPLRTHLPQTTQTGRKIELQRGGNAALLPNSSLRTSPQPAKTGSLTPNSSCAWSASGRGSLWWDSPALN